MDDTKFKEIEEKYKELKEQLDRGEVTSDEMKTTLKEMMVLDDKGNYWMIGGKTGKWYLYDGTEWKEGNPYKDDSTKTKLFPQDTESTLREETAEIERIDQVDEMKKSDEIEETEYKIDEAEPEEKEVEIKIDEAEPEEKEVEISMDETGPEVKKEKKDVDAATKRISTLQLRESELLIKSVKITSLIFFLGGFGLGLGVIFGAIFGIFPIMGDLIYRFGPMLAETHGKIQGGLIFAAVGGFGGFIIFSIIAIILSGLYNVISSLIGGIRFKVKF